MDRNQSNLTHAASPLLHINIYIGASPSPDVLYTCRCGRFSPDGSFLFTIHYLRRGPKHADKRPWLTKWAVEEGPDKRLVLTALLTKPIGKRNPLMCLDLSDDGLLGVAGRVG